MGNPSISGSSFTPIDRSLLPETRELIGAFAGRKYHPNAPLRNYSFFNSIPEQLSKTHKELTELRENVSKELKKAGQVLTPQAFITNPQKFSFDFHGYLDLKIAYKLLRENVLGVSKSEGDQLEKMKGQILRIERQLTRLENTHGDAKVNNVVAKLHHALKNPVESFNVDNLNQIRQLFQQVKENISPNESRYLREKIQNLEKHQGEISPAILKRYWGSMTTQDVRSVLRPLAQGTALLRYSERRNTYILSIKDSPNSIRHIPIDGLKSITKESLKQMGVLKFLEFPSAAHIKFKNPTQDRSVENSKQKVTETAQKPTQKPLEYSSIPQSRKEPPLKDVNSLNDKEGWNLLVDEARYLQEQYALTSELPEQHVMQAKNLLQKFDGRISTGNYDWDVWLKEFHDFMQKH